MTRRIACLFLVAFCLLLCGCSLLERDYRSVEPHSYSYREDADENALRVSSYQDLVNAVLLLTENHQEAGRIHIYVEDAASAWEMMRDAREEILQETPAGAYALEYIGWKSAQQRDYWEVDLTLTYRRTAEEEEAIIDASSSNAVYDLIPFAQEEQRQCLAVRFAHLEETPEELVQGILALQSSESEAEDTEPEGSEDDPSQEPTWQVYLYPNNENAGIVEIFFW